jgi:type II secretory ATPase GspE/PulE/Tfp pilus assembly ATPase PilB-like protein
MQASNTGHRVFATVHAADCVRTFSRLLDFDISKTTLLSELKLIVSQRLVATLCPHCSHPHQLTEEEKHLLSEDEIAYVQGHLMERGTPNEIRSCGKCNHGYIGRTAVAEFIELDTELRDALLNQHSFTEIQNVLRKRGFRTMWEKGLDMAVRGQIELDELIHVVGKE